MLVIPQKKSKEQPKSKFLHFYNSTLSFSRIQVELHIFVIILVE